MDLQDIKSRIFKDEEGISNYIHVSIEEMDWLVEQAGKTEMYRKKYKNLVTKIISAIDENQKL